MQEVRPPRAGIEDFCQLSLKARTASDVKTTSEQLDMEVADSIHVVELEPTQDLTRLR